MMDRLVITESNSKVSKIISASAEMDADIICLECKDTLGGVTKLNLDLISANGLRIAIGALQKIPRLVLPFNEKGEYLSHFPMIKYTLGETLFYKKDQNSEPLGKYVDIEDGMLMFNKGKILWVAFSVKEAIINELSPKKYFVLSFPDTEVLSDLKKTLDKKIFPFERFGKTNKLSYGYFHTIKDEEA